MTRGLIALLTGSALLALPATAFEGMAADEICAALEVAGQSGSLTVSLYSEGDHIGFATGENPDMARCTSDALAGATLCRTLLPYLQSEWPQGLLWTIHDGCLERDGAVLTLQTNDDWTGLRERPKAVLHMVGTLRRGATLDLQRKQNDETSDPLVDATLSLAAPK